MRSGARIWSGYVVVNRSGPCCYGKRISREAYGQWEVDDIILQGGEDSSNFSWQVEDSITLGPRDEMFDDTLLRPDGNQYTSVSKAVDALNSGALSCSAGICIVYSSAHQGYCLLVRSDKKAAGMRIYWDVTERAALQREIAVGQ